MDTAGTKKRRLQSGQAAPPAKTELPAGKEKKEKEKAPAAAAAAAKTANEPAKQPATKAGSSGGSGSRLEAGRGGAGGAGGAARGAAEGAGTASLSGRVSRRALHASELAQTQEAMAQRPEELAVALGMSLQEVRKLMGAPQALK